MNLASVENLILEIESRLEGRKLPLLIALDGRSGTGKSTIAESISRKLSATLICCDDFYSGGKDTDWISRTPQEKVNQCIDWRRIRNEVLKPLLEGCPVIYHPFDFKTGVGLALDTIECKPAKVIILDGAYSARPELADLVDIKVLVQLVKGIRRDRLLQREGASFMERWHSIWDEAEDYYFSQVCPPSSYDFVIALR